MAINIISKPTVTLNQCYNFTLTVDTASSLCIDLIPIIYEGSLVRGLDPAMTLSQIYYETAYFNYTGVLDASYHNVGGLKIPAGGGDKDPDAHKRFDSWYDGINAFLDHLCLYAGGYGYPKYSKDVESYYNIKKLSYDSASLKNNGETLDPRQFPYLFGKCKTIESLTGNWCPQESYSTNIINIAKKIQNASNENPGIDTGNIDNVNEIDKQKIKEILSKIADCFDELSELI